MSNPQDLTEPSEEVKAMARRIAVEAGWRVGSLFFRAAEKTAITAILETQRRDAELCAEFGSPHVVDEAGAVADDIAQAILTGTHYGKAEQ